MKTPNTLPTRTQDTALRSFTRVSPDREISGMLDQVQKTGGLMARWRISRAVNAESVGMMQDVIGHHIAAKRDEWVFRISLNLDEAKKHAMADNMARVTDIDREISRITAETINVIETDVFSVKRQAMQEEVSREAELKALLDAGRIAPHRHEVAVKDIQQATDRICASTEAIAEKLIQNLGRRLDAALANAE